ncbi:MAG: hypothetical protein V2A61_02045 [Calditrichota bacterium]
MLKTQSKILYRALPLLFIQFVLLNNFARANIIARYGGEFMAGGGGARALGIGSAYAAQTGEAWCLFWNPSGLAELSYLETALMHSERFTGIVDYDVAAVAQPQPDGSVLASGFIRLGVNGIPFTRKERPGAPLGDDNRVVVTKIVNEGEYAFYIAKAAKWGRWRWGVAPKLVFKHLGSDYRAYGLGVDVGVSGRPINQIPIEVGCVARDLWGTLLAWEQTGRKEIIVSSLRLGLASQFEVKALEARITPAVDVSYRLESLGDPGAGAVHWGLEYLVHDLVALRVGRDDTRLTFGGGLSLRPVSLDYAYVDHDQLGETHRVSLALRWGR